TKRPASRDRFGGAVRLTHHRREIERLPRQTNFLSMILVQKVSQLFGVMPAIGVRTNLLFTMSNRTGSRPKAAANLDTNDFSHMPKAIAPGKTSSRHQEWWSRTGSNRRHPACKAGALPA